MTAGYRAFSTGVNSVLKALTLMSAFADSELVSTCGDVSFLEDVPGTQGIPHRTIENAGHFVQEDQPQAYVEALLDIAKLL